MLNPKALILMTKGHVATITHTFTATHGEWHDEALTMSSAAAKR